MCSTHKCLLDDGTERSEPAEKEAAGSARSKALNIPSAQPGYAIRFVASDDVPAVLALVREVLAEFGFCFGIGAKTDDELTDLPGSYLDRGGAFWVLVDGPGAIVGTCGLFPVREHVFELRKMYLAPPVRGRGL